MATTRRPVAGLQKLHIPGSPPPRRLRSSAMRNRAADLGLLLGSILSLCCAAACAHCPTSCGNLPPGSVLFPWGAEKGCGSSPAFLLSGCNTGQALWSLDLPDLKTPLTYAVQGIYYTGFGGSAGFVNLTTLPKDPAYAPSICDPTSDESASDTYFPPISSTFPWAQTLKVSDAMSYLLFDCSDPPEIPSPLSTTACASYGTVCPSLYAAVSARCLLLQDSQDLESAMDEFKCTHFTSFWRPDNYSNSSVPFVYPSAWDRSLLQLYWAQPSFQANCSSCVAQKGECEYTVSSANVSLANVSFYCSHSTDCKSIVCNRTMKGILFGVVPAAGVGMVALLMVLVMRRRKRYTSRSTVRTSSGSTNHKYWTQRALGLSHKYGHASVKEFSYAELLQATDSFADSRMIGDGGFGAVYLAHLKDGRKAAVKRLYHDNFKRMDHFYNEIRILSSLKHPNLVRLYGFCCQDNRDLLLVFEFASHGTVADHLHDLSKEGLPWRVRLSIAYETAQGLSYLHNNVSPPIFHRDVKTTNILLDQNFHAKLADFGLSRLVPLEATHVSTAPQGTPGYLDPDYHQCYQLTDKSDVYSFGVVLIELVSAKLAVDMSRDRREINLSNLALMKITGGAWEELVDPRLRIHEDANVERMVKGVVELAFSCLHAEKDDRPTMSHVTEVLSKLRDSGYPPGDHSTDPSKVDMEETSILIKPQLPAYSPTSVHSVWPSSNTSAELSILY